MSDDQRTGRCLCGAVTFTVTLPNKKVHVCHCSICQKWEGGPSLSLQCNANWEIEGEGSLTWYDSSPHAQRGFCKTCGTHLFFREKSGAYHGIPAGVLDTQDGLEIDSHIFIDKKPPYYDFTDSAPRLTEKAFWAMIEKGAGTDGAS